MFDGGKPFGCHGIGIAVGSMLPSTFSQERRPLPEIARREQVVGISGVREIDARVPPSASHPGIGRGIFNRMREAELHPDLQGRELLRRGWPRMLAQSAKGLIGAVRVDADGGPVEVHDCVQPLPLNLVYRAGIIVREPGHWLGDQAPHLTSGRPIRMRGGRA